MSYAGQNAWHAHILEIHSQALKHDFDIADNLGIAQAVGGRTGACEIKLEISWN